MSQSDITKIKATLDTAIELTGKAIAIASGAPYFTYIDHDTTAVRLQIKDDKAVLVWTTCTSGYYGACEEEKHTKEIDAELLLMTFTEISTWGKQQKIIYDAEQKRTHEIEQASILRRQEAYERETLARLKAKYEGVA